MSAAFNPVHAEPVEASSLSLSAFKEKAALRQAQGKRRKFFGSGRSVAAIASLLLLAACGKQERLRPVAGEPLPPRPATAPVQPTPEQLLAQRPTFRPGRSDELLTKSATRPDDRFDLPPR